jgi:YbgC/YbaW family acyl-CoA thioester hydrolase
MDQYHSLMPPSTTTLRVRYAETDQMGVAYYANYFIWCEIGRVELLRQLGFEYKQMELEHNCHLPVVEASCRYKSPARYDDLVTIETRVSGLRTSVIKFSYRLFCFPGWRSRAGSPRRGRNRPRLNRSQHAEMPAARTLSLRHPHRPGELTMPPRPRLACICPRACPEQPKARKSNGLGRCG